MEATTIEKNGANNYLTDRQSYDLVTWMKGSQVALQTHNASGFKCAEMATQDLGFLVTEGNIRGKLEQFPECRWKPVKSENATPSDDVAALYQMIQTLSARMSCLEGEMANVIYIKGEETPIPQTNGSGRLFREA